MGRRRVSPFGRSAGGVPYFRRGFERSPEKTGILPTPLLARYTMTARPLMILATLALIPTVHAEIDASALEGAVGTAPAACYTNTACAGAGCARESSGDAACSGGAGKCGWGQSWHVNGHYDEGNGTVKFHVKCGDDEYLVDCEVGAPGVDCSSDVGGGRGPFGCLADIPSTVPADAITGFCKDPLNPRIVYLVAPSGLPYDVERNMIDLVEEVELVLLHALA